MAGWTTPRPKLRRWARLLKAAPLAVLALVCACLALPQPAAAGSQMLVKANEVDYDYTNHRVAAVGNVQIYSNAATIEADRVVYAQVTTPDGAGAGGLFVSLLVSRLVVSAFEPQLWGGPERQQGLVQNADGEIGELASW